jgi:hypothetical protein
MKLHKVSRSIRRLTLLAAITGGTIFQGNACLTQPAREALLLGLQDTFMAFVSTMLDTFFIQLISPPTSQPSDTVI